MSLRCGYPEFWRRVFALKWAGLVMRPSVIFLATFKVREVKAFNARLRT